MRRLTLLLVLFAFVGACESPSGPDPDPTPGLNVTGEPCSTATANCRIVTAHQIGPESYALWSQPQHQGAAYICDVSRETLDQAKFGTYWQCDWRSAGPLLQKLMTLSAR